MQIREKKDSILEEVWKSKYLDKYQTETIEKGSLVRVSR